MSTRPTQMRRDWLGSLRRKNGCLDSIIYYIPDHTNSLDILHLQNSSQNRFRSTFRTFSSLGLSMFIKVIMLWKKICYRHFNDNLRLLGGQLINLRLLAQVGTKIKHVRSDSFNFFLFAQSGLRAFFRTEQWLPYSSPLLFMRSTPRTALPFSPLLYPCLIPLGFATARRTARNGGSVCVERNRVNIIPQWWNSNMDCEHGFL